MIFRGLVFRQNVDKERFMLRWRQMFTMLLVFSIAFAIMGCNGGAAKNDETPKQDLTPKPAEPKKEQAKPDQPEAALDPIDENLKAKIFDLLKQEKFEDAQMELVNAAPKNDWIAAYMIFVASALEALKGPAIELPPDVELKRQAVQQFLAANEPGKALYVLFQIQPKNEKDIENMIDITTGMFVKVKAQKVAADMQTIAQAYKTKSESDEYGKALIRSAKFFKQRGNEIEELAKIHFPNIAAGSKEEWMAQMAGHAKTNKYSQIYFSWYRAYMEFDKIFSQLRQLK